MISVITSSVNKTYLRQFEESLKSSIGVEYELIAVDNTIHNFGICKVYNDAAAKAKYPYLCFVHEDVKFWTANWGRYMLETLQNKSIGLLGVCGGKYYPNVPGAWLDIPVELRRFNMISEINGGTVHNTVKDDPEKHLSTTVTLDGLLLAMRKITWSEFHFDEELIKGFHFYDIDISLRVGTKYKLAIDHRFFVGHLGPGQYVTKNWIENALEFYDHRPIKGPVSVELANKPPLLEDFAIKRFLERIAGVNDGNWRRTIIWKLFYRFPFLLLRNIRFYRSVLKALNKAN